MPTHTRIPAFKREAEAGNLAFLAAQAALSAMGIQRSLAFLTGASGDAFKFVYDAAPIRTPLRDLRPVDTLARAYAACGLRAEWVPDATLDHVRGQVEAQAGVGQPVLTSQLPGGSDAGFTVLAGYDEDTDTLTYQQASEQPQADAPYATLALVREPAWSGPTTGAPHWVDFPLLVVRGPLYDPPDEATQRRTALQTALDSLDADPLPYPDHPDAQAQADVPLADRSAPQGLAALAALAADLADAPLDDFATIWRLDAQLGQLAWDRSLAVLYLQTWEGAAPATLIAQYRTIAHTARTLLSRSWEQRSARMDCLDDLKLFISGTAAYVYALPDDPKLQAVDDLGQRLTTPWGPALIVDTPQRRSSAIKLAERLADLEAGCKPLLQAAQSGV